MTDDELWAIYDKERKLYYTYRQMAQGEGLVAGRHRRAERIETARRAWVVQLVVLGEAAGPLEVRDMLVRRAGGDTRGVKR